MIGAYLAALASAGRADLTLRLRGWQLRRFAAAVGGDPWAVSPGDAARYLARYRSPETLKSHRAAIRGLYLWGIRGGLTAADPPAALPRGRVPRGQPRPCPPGVRRAAVAAADPDTALMLRLGALCGLRRAEIAAVAGADLAGRWLRIRGKGGHVRQVPVPVPLPRMIADRGHGWTFPAGQGHLSPDAVGRRISRALPDGWTAHTLRHGYATAAYAATGDLRAVQELLGHASPTTTARYVAVADDAMAAAADGAVRAYGGTVGA